jgi:murein L,D-transpeptidase YcbB/YkuD
MVKLKSAWYRRRYLLLFALILPAAAATQLLTLGPEPTPDQVSNSIERHLRQARAPSELRAQEWRAVLRLYERRDYRPLWMDGREPTSMARSLLGGLHEVEREGLRLADYPLARLTRALQDLDASPDTSPEDIARVDLLFTTLFGALAGDMWSGRFRPQEVQAHWRIERKAEDFVSVLERALAGRRLEQAIAMLRPQDEGYAQLVEALSRYLVIDGRGGWPQVPAGRPLKKGDHGERVATLRKRLQVEGYLPSSFTRLAGRDSRFDSRLADAVARFQERHGLAVDGSVGPATLTALNVPVERRILQIQANLERYRWLPRDLGERYLVVNIPAFRLDAFEHGERVLSMPVVVGSELDSATPVFADSIAYVQFAPYWNVPARIAREEILPKAAADPGYLEQQGFEIVEEAAAGEQVIRPAALSEQDLTAEEFPYRLRQRPGPDNPLGRVKFMFPNEYAVYLHDTPGQHLMERPVRAFSHGCVRVADPTALAEFVLRHNGHWDARRISEAMNAWQPVQAQVEGEIGVYLLYLTSFVRDGELMFRNDLYDMDGPLIQALTREPQRGREVG